MKGLWWDCLGYPQCHYYLQALQVCVTILSSGRPAAGDPDRSFHMVLYGARKSEGYGCARLGIIRRLLQPDKVLQRLRALHLQKPQCGRHAVDWEMQNPHLTEGHAFSVNWRL